MSPPSLFRVHAHPSAALAVTVTVAIAVATFSATFFNTGRAQPTFQPRESITPGSAPRRGGYGTAEMAGGATPSTAGGGEEGGGGRTPQHSLSPRRKGKRRYGGYTELPSPHEGGWTLGGGSRDSVRGGRGSAEGFEDEDDDEDDEEEDEEDEDGDGEAGSAPPKVRGEARGRGKRGR